MTVGARLRRLRGDAGYSVVELLTVMAILGAVMTGLTTLFVAGSKAEVDMNERFQAQQNAVLALQKLRREVHCASSATPQGTPVNGWYPQVKVTLASYCKTGSGDYTWCTVSLGTKRYGLFRKQGASCDSAGVKWADHLTSATVFKYEAQSSASLARLHIDFPVDIDPNKSQAAYRLQDAIALRNSSRT